MSAENKNCLINESACGRVAGNPVCPKCGMDERVVYPGQADLTAALQQARNNFSFQDLNEQILIKDSEIQKAKANLQLSNQALKVTQEKLNRCQDDIRKVDAKTEISPSKRIVNEWVGEIDSDLNRVLDRGVILFEPLFPAQKIHKILVLAFVLALSITLILTYKHAYAGDKFEPQQVKAEDLINGLAPSLYLDMVGGCKAGLSMALSAKNLIASERLGGLFFECEQRKVNSILLYRFSELLFIVLAAYLLITLISVNRIAISSSRITVSRGFANLLGTRFLRWDEIISLSYAGRGIWCLNVAPSSNRENGRPLLFKIGSKSNIENYTINRGLALIQCMVEN